MAIARLEMKVGKTGKAASHAAYITRDGKYKNGAGTTERLLATESGNMPAWAQADPLAFWSASDTYERANGTTYREMEIALPRELNDEQQIALVQRWVKEEIGKKHAYQWAIHIPKAADGGDQPHLHLMFSERQVDDIERDPNQYFKRYNSKTPEKGGARKGYGEHAGQTLSKDERVEDLKALRLRWQKTANNFLSFMTDSKNRIDMRSYADRGLDIEAEPKQLPSAWRGTGKVKILELRAAKEEYKEAATEVEETIPLIKITAESLKQHQENVIRLARESKSKREIELAVLRLMVFQEELIDGKLPIHNLSGINQEAERRWVERYERQLAEEQAEKIKEEKIKKLALQEEIKKAKDTITSWDSEINHRIEMRSRHLERCKQRLNDELKSIARNREDLLAAHQKVNPQPSLLRIFSRSSYEKEMQAWINKNESIRRRGEERERDLQRRLKVVIDHMIPPRTFLSDVGQQGLFFHEKPLVNKVINHRLREQPDLEERITKSVRHLRLNQEKIAEEMKKPERKRTSEGHRRRGPSR